MPSSCSLPSSFAFGDVGDVHPIRDAVGGVGALDDVVLADLLREPAQLAHPVLDRPRGELLGEPARDQHLHVPGLEALGPQPAHAHLVQLVGDEIEDVRPVGLGGVAAVTVVPAEFLEVVVQVAHESSPIVRALYEAPERRPLLPW